ncbi:DUF1360 domain-containing protein [Actinacidiphila glaucinigra]|uniref:DUF1360 domain-containing protein n=1 Tax=Actinacidiphila glaucinigra TaxID=235986 RepID=UPI0036ED0342
MIPACTQRAAASLACADRVVPAQANVERCAVAAPAKGETLTCPFCVGLCISTGLAAGLVFAPSVTRLAAGTLTALPLSDLLRTARERARHAAEE